MFKNNELNLYNKEVKRKYFACCLSQLREKVWIIELELNNNQITLINS